MKLLLLLVPVAMGLVTLDGRESSLLCPGEEVEYFCHSSTRVNSITWMIQCPNNENLTPSFSAENDGMTESLSCTADDGDYADNVSLDLTISYATTDDETWSNLNISVLDANYSIGSLTTLKVDCEGSRNYRYLELTGPPLPPTNMSYSFTKSNTTLSWLLPPSGSMDHHAVDMLTLSYVPTQATSNEEPVTIYLAHDSTNVTVSLDLLSNMLYEVTLFATSCGGSLRSESISISVTSQLSGLPCPALSNLSYNFTTTCNDTHLPTTFSWLLPFSEHHPPEELVLSYTPTSPVADNETDMMMLANDSTNVTVFLQYNETYDVTLYANSCGGSLKSDNISINLTLPEYEAPSFPGLQLVDFDIDTLVLSFRCPSRMEVMEAECGEDGQWSPEPSNDVCTSGNVNQETSPEAPMGSVPWSAIASIAGVLGTIIFLLFSVTVVSIILLKLQIHSKVTMPISEGRELEENGQTESHDQGEVVYDEIPRTLELPTSDGNSHFPAQGLVRRDLHSEGTQGNGRCVTHRDGSIDPEAPSSLPDGTTSEDYFALNGQDSFSPQRHFVIHGHQDTADITAGPHASAVYDIITSPPALDEQDTSYDARYDIVKHAPAHQKTTPPDSTPTAALYDVLKHAAPASRKIRAKRAVPDPILSACYSTINVPIVPPRLGVAVSPPAGDRMDAAIPTAEVGRPDVVPVLGCRLNGTNPYHPAAGDDAIRQVMSLDVQEAAYAVPLELDRNPQIASLHNSEPVYGNTTGPNHSIYQMDTMDAVGHMTEYGDHLTSGIGHVTKHRRDGAHASTASRVTCVAEVHHTADVNHVTSDVDHMTAGDSHMTADGSHMTAGDSHMTADGSHVQNRFNK